MTHDNCYAVIFISTLAKHDQSQPDSTKADSPYAMMAAQMETLASQQPGYLGIESTRQGRRGITISYWESTDAIERWKRQFEHQAAQQQGRDLWYENYQVQIAKVERAYAWPTNPKR